MSTRVCLKNLLFIVLFFELPLKMLFSGETPGDEGDEATFPRIYSLRQPNRVPASLLKTTYMYEPLPFVTTINRGFSTIPSGEGNYISLQAGRLVLFGTYLPDYYPRRRGKDRTPLGRVLTVALFYAVYVYRSRWIMF